MRVLALLVLLIALLTGCTRAEDPQSQSQGVSVSVSEEAPEPKYAKIVGSRLCWEIPDWTEAEQIKNGFVVSNEDKEFGIIAYRQSIWELDNSYVSGTKLQDGVLQSNLIDMLSKFDGYSVDKTEKVEVDGQSGFLVSGDYGGSKCFRLLCMQFGSDLVVIAGTAPSELEKELNDTVNAVRVARVIYTSWGG